MMKAKGVPGSERIRVQGAEYRYHLLRAALAAGNPGLAGLDADQLTAICEKADKTFELESLVLGAPEAAEIQVPEKSLEDAVAEIRARYSDREEFLTDLAGNGLDEGALRHALHRELRFDALMRRVAARRPEVSEMDQRLFFELHRDRFVQPQRRTVRQILVTINEALAENRRDSARARIEQLADRLGGRANRFPSLARKYSECPSALEDGRLGTVTRGQLYPSLDAALFALPEGQISSTVESELGFHLLWCEKIHQRRTLAFSRVKAPIRRLLEERAGRNCQRAWIAALRQAYGPGASSEAGR